MPAPFLVIFALATSVPTINLDLSCRGARSGAVIGDSKLAYQSCLKDEAAARQQLVRRWSQIPAAARASCVDEAMQLSPSYVELLTCLEMRTGGNFSGAPTGPPPAPPNNSAKSPAGGSTAAGATQPPTNSTAPAAGAVSSAPASPIPNSVQPNASAAKVVAPATGASPK